MVLTHFVIMNPCDFKECCGSHYYFHLPILLLHTVIFYNISPAVHILPHKVGYSSKSHAITFLSALILSSCSRDHACKFIYEDLINPTVYFNMHCSCKNPPQLYASKHPNLSKQAAFLFAR